MVALQLLISAVLAFTDIVNRDALSPACPPPNLRDHYPPLLNFHPPALVIANLSENEQQPSMAGESYRRLGPSPCTWNSWNARHSHQPNPIPIIHPFPTV
ncbi:uncharacterized protein BO95DRAFT_444677 [Aspergillus brunneoviolaceus CBS 621.78]|uniref:Uncharacterized protein n=1 Tax=Aspergillus brunneoviolaceus CBS 621.78 TaxID=1450534 RepID=A0ACD1G3W5_9EURO|nr:hypothetical protein BO95DRAFT_444677 [Aspergillus brunneoviolaceus CBS 621.78]RAH43907.1 hypothetical protein BO95DRAFT_444677 [Aspergillus brunneoviolaceus CBS 621.78]